MLLRESTNENWSMASASSDNPLPNAFDSTHTLCQKCVFCSRVENEVCGPLRSNGQLAFHYFCALFSSGLAQCGDKESELWGFLPEDIAREIRRANRLTCRFCKERGASVGCSVKSCRVAFHFPCGVENSILAQYFGTFRTFCVDHRPQQTPSKSMSEVVTICGICMCDVETSIPTNDVIQMPCCQHNLLHRSCLQHQATSCGLTHFKCALCNDTERFQAEMLCMGINIPDQYAEFLHHALSLSVLLAYTTIGDAAWEMEDDAFGDLLERHSRCDVDECRCPDGRDTNLIDTCWEIMLCDGCGSLGTHLACSGLMTPLDDWNCIPCVLTLRRILLADLRSEDRESAAKRQPSPPPVEIVNPCRRRLSSYMGKYSQTRQPETAAVAASQPRWLRCLLNDDVHTGHNMGVKLSSFCKMDSSE